MEREPLGLKAGNIYRMLDNRLLDFNAQAEQLLQIIETRLAIGQRDSALQYLIFKFKTLYEQGVVNGRRAEREETHY